MRHNKITPLTIIWILSIIASLLYHLLDITRILKPLTPHPSLALAFESLQRRATELKSQLLLVRESSTNSPSTIISVPHLETAEALHAELQTHLSSVSCSLLSSPQNLPLTRSFLVEGFRLIVETQVEIDFASHPEIDPSHGWVSLRAFEEEFYAPGKYFLDTQLYRLSLDIFTNGGISGFEYKPRKLDFALFHEPALAGPYAVHLAFLDPLPTSVDECIAAISTSSYSAQLPGMHREMQKTPGILALRNSQTYISGEPQKTDPEIVLQSTSLFRAGLGAHRANSTTGFSTESWIESASGRMPEDLYVLFCHHFSLPTTEATSVSIYPLQGAGSVVQVTVDGTFRGELKSIVPTLPECYGVQIVEGLTSLIFELRTSKPIDRCYLYPTTTNDDEYLGTNILFCIKASRLFEDSQAVTTFLSIL